MENISPLINNKKNYKIKRNSGYLPENKKSLIDLKKNKLLNSQKVIKLKTNIKSSFKLPQINKILNKFERIKVKKKTFLILKNDKSHFLHLYCYADTLQGYIPNMKKENQDNYFIHQFIHKDNKIYLLCVFDGHGPDGHFISNFSSKYILKNLTEFIKEEKIINFENIKKLFLKCHEEISNSKEFNPYISGTTVNLVIIINNIIYNINLGDSRFIFQNYKKKLISSTDHKPEDINEKQRIEEYGGEVKQIYCIFISK